MGNKTNKWWKRRQEKDIFVKKRKELQLISRAYFKIKEIDEKFKIFKENSLVLDLGSAPGSWLQYFNKKTNKSYGIDILPLKIEHKNFFQIDIENFKSDLNFDLIASDIAPNLSGNRSADQSKMCNIIDMIFSIIKDNLKIGGNFVTKVFEGESSQEAIRMFKPLFRILRVFKPQSSRKESSEIYIICLDKK